MALCAKGAHAAAEQAESRQDRLQDDLEAAQHGKSRRRQHARGGDEHDRSGQILAPRNVALVTGLLTASVEVALRVAAPLLALIFLQTVAMGFVAKTVPQLNILSLGFPLRILGGLLIVTLGLVVINDVVMEMVDDVMHLIFELFG